MEYFIRAGGRKVNVPKGSKGCISEASPVRPTEEKLGRVEYNAAMFKDPSEMDGEEFEWWLNAAPAEALEEFCSINKARTVTT